jgi:hypothetical protein
MSFYSWAKSLRSLHRFSRQPSLFQARNQFFLQRRFVSNLHKWDLVDLSNKCKIELKEAYRIESRPRVIAATNVGEIVNKHIGYNPELNPNNKLETLKDLLQYFIDCREAVRMFVFTEQFDFVEVAQGCMDLIKRSLPLNYDEIDGRVKKLVEEHKIPTMDVFVNDYLPIFETDEERLMARASARAIFVEEDPADWVET